jgi:hypothetical protein
MRLNALSPLSLTGGVWTARYLDIAIRRYHDFIKYKLSSANLGKVIIS